VLDKYRIRVCSYTSDVTLSACNAWDDECDRLTDDYYDTIATQAVVTAAAALGYR